MHSADDERWYEGVDPETNYQYWYALRPDGTCVNSSWTRPEGVVFGSVTDEDAGYGEEEHINESEIAAETNACKLCGDLNLFALKTDGQHCFCCEKCGWTQPCSKEVFDQIQRQKYTRMLEHENSEACEDDQHDGKISSTVSPDPSKATRGTVITDYIGLAKKGIGHAVHEAAGASDWSKKQLHQITKSTLNSEVAKNVTKWSQDQMSSIKRTLGDGVAAAKEKYPHYFTTTTANGHTLASKHLPRFRELLSCGYDAVEIFAGKSAQTCLRVSPGDVVYWFCFVLDHDVKFVPAIRSMQHGGSVEVPIQSIAKIPSGHLIQGLHSVPLHYDRDVFVVLKWDNSYSWYTPKHIACKVGIRQKFVSSNAADQVVTPDSPSALSAQQPSDSVSKCDTHTISSDTPEKQASIGMMEEESLAELMEALPDPENVFSDAV